MRNTVAEATYVFIVDGPVMKGKWIFQKANDIYEMRNDLFIQCYLLLFLWSLYGDYQIHD